MNLHFRSSITQGHLTNLEALGGEVEQSSGDVEEAVKPREEQGALSRESVDVVVNKVDSTTTAEAEEGEVAGLVGRIMISLREIVTRLSISSPTGRCWTRSISTDC